jgi:hypothetical protein
MINVQDFLLNNNIEIGTYALVSYNNMIEAVWFTRYNDPRTWFLESPCELYILEEINESTDIENFCKEYIEGRLEDGENEDEYIEKYLKPMIINRVLYEIENFQCARFLPECVDNIELISARECLEFLLKQCKNN